jgi:rhodanese-related sulfurtransferase
MIEKVFEFIGNHFALIGLFIALAIAFLVNEGKRGGASVSTNTLINMVNRNNALVLDVRDSKDYKAGHIVDSLNIPYANFDKRAEELEKHKERPIIIVCKMGQHAGAVGSKLKALGFEDVRRLGGGMAEWTATNLPIVKA